MIDYTVQEVRRFFCFVFQKAIHLTESFLFESSNWRRRHQYVARVYHYKAQFLKISTNLQL